MQQLALIGTGRWGTNILRTLESIPGVRVTHVCARSKKHLAPLLGRYQKVQDVRVLFREKNIDGVIIATPASTHAALALPFLRRGIPVFIEKPMTTSVADAAKIARAARKAGTWVFAGHLHLFNPAYRKMKESLRSLGTIRAIVCAGMSGGPPRVDTSVLWDWGSHDVYMIIDLLGSVPRAVQAWGITARRSSLHHDFTLTRMFYPKHVEAYCISSWISPTKVKRVTVTCAKGTAVFEDTAEQKVTVLRDGKGSTHPRYGSRPALEEELRAFVLCLRTGKRPLAGGEDGMKVIRVLAAAEQSIGKDGKTVVL